MIRCVVITGSLQRVLLIVSSIALLLATNVHAASLYTETFTGSIGGWQDRSAGAMVVTNVLSGGNPGGAIRGIFPLEAGPPGPLIEDGIIATGRTDSANFIGNYSEVDAWLLRFDFMASNIVPSAFSLLIYSGTSNVITRTLTSAIVTNNLWHSFRISLLASDLGGWGGSVAQFNSIMTNVTRVEFRLTRNLENAQAYLLDNISLSRVPDAVDLTGLDLTWLHIRNGANYRFEGTTNLNDGASWTLIESFTATSSVYVATLPPTNDWRYFRLLEQ